MRNNAVDPASHMSRQLVSVQRPPRPHDSVPAAGPSRASTPATARHARKLPHQLLLPTAPHSSCHPCSLPPPPSLPPSLQGIQAQTVANFYLAFDQGLDLVPCVNKVDLPTADVEGCVQQMVDAFDVNPGGGLGGGARAQYCRL